MKKIPGTTYKFDISLNHASKIDLKIYHHHEIIFEQSNIDNQRIIVEILLRVLINNNLNIPKNRIERIVQDEMKIMSPTQDYSFKHQIVSTMIDIQPEIQKKILLMGLSNAGKTCIYERIFEGKTPWELMHTSATKGIAYKNYELDDISKPSIWDLGGQDQYLESYHNELKNKIFENLSIFLYVVDLTDYSKFDNSEKEFSWAIQNIRNINPNTKIYILFHKQDLVPEKEKIMDYARKLFSKGIDMNISFFATSIIDESLFIVWSEIIREISPKSTFINYILKQLKNQKGITNALVIEKRTGLTCGSTMEESEEDLIIGMVSLLIKSIDRFIKELNLNQLQELSLKTEDYEILLINVNKNLLLVLILDKVNIDNYIEKVKTNGLAVCDQLRKLMSEV